MPWLMKVNKTTTHFSFLVFSQLDDQMNYATSPRSFNYAYKTAQLLGWNSMFTPLISQDNDKMYHFSVSQNLSIVMNFENEATSLYFPESLDNP